MEFGLTSSSTGRRRLFGLSSDPGPRVREISWLLDGSSGAREGPAEFDERGRGSRSRSRRSC